MTGGRAPRRFRALALAAGVLALGLVGACRRSSVYPHAPIVLISIDTLRSDHLPAYGYSGVETPAITKLQADSILFEHAWSQVPLTLPSHATILSGLLPGEHGVRDNLGYRFRADLHPDLPVLLGKAGYHTGGAISAYVLRPETGIAAGFDFYEGAVDLKANETMGRAQRPCRETLAVSSAWLDQNASGPFFYFAHFYEPHTPYEPEAKFAARYANPYDGEIATVDECVGDLVQHLKRLGVYDRAIVVLLSDHGEGLGDHGEPEHGILLYREALQVPLLVKLPQSARGGTRVATNAALVDLMPTLLALVGLPVPPATQGTPLLTGSGPAAARPIYSETFYPRLHLGWHELASIVSASRHLIEGPDPELYNLASDPGERVNLRDRDRRSFSELRAAVAGFARALQPAAAEDAESAAKLAALGYLSAAKVATGTDLPDPKSKVASLQEYSRAVRALTAQDYAQAATLFAKLAVENPSMVDAWENLGIAQGRLGLRQEAARSLAKAMELSGGADHVALALGNVLLDLDRFDEAQKHAELAIATSPAPAHSLLARIALRRHDLPTAEREAREALAARGSRLGPLVVLAQVLLEEGKLDEALATTDTAVDALAKSSDHDSFSGLYFVRGDALARLGRTAEAEAAFQREIHDYPASPDAYSRLAALYASLGRSDDAFGVLRALVGRNPDAPVAWAEAARTLRVLGDPVDSERLLAEARRRFPGDALLAASAHR